MGLAQYESIVLSYFLDHSICYVRDKIPYGVRFKLFDGRVSLNLYHGKKGFTFYIQGKDGEAAQQLQEEMNLLFSMDRAPSKTSTDLAACYDVPWMGSDESGKGDVFGPLVCAGVVLLPADTDYLIASGFRDSKALTSGKIGDLVKKIFRLGTDRYYILSLKPSKYNDLYDQFKSQEKNLNHLLGWMHATVIKELVKKNPNAEIAVVDQFSKTDHVGGLLGPAGDKINLIQRTRAESNLAVAAGSILARNELLRWHSSQKEELGYSLPLGAGPQTINAGKRYVAEHGVNALRNVAKMHFKTIGQILD
ncbi:ribonuclease HIII [bacterium]|jgi:ribonuclease HIII|nr:ribonuclease HIII [bacterium]